MMESKQETGVLCHITSLPEQKLSQGYRFVDWLKEKGFSYWQLLPLTPPDKYQSPYASPSAFAGWDNLTKSTQSHAMDDEAHWLEDWALYCAIKDDQNGKPWYEWPDSLKNRNEEALAPYQKKLEPYLQAQRSFNTEWQELRLYANANGVRVIGDVPIFIAHDSADVWAHRELFQLDDDGYPTFVAGVPPDYFSETGQVWETVLYNWDAHREEQWTWWKERMKRMFRLYDVVRIDHFRGFHSNWAIPYPGIDARTGHWQDGPKDELFEQIMRLVESPDQIIAEDLGIIPKEVVAFRQRQQLKGMAVLQFGFTGDSDTNPHHPANILEDQVVYTGTHDNNTAIGWFQSATATEQSRLKSLSAAGEDVHETMMRLAQQSKAPIAIIPLQDYLGLGSEARMNTPGQKGQNWGWRFTWRDLER